MECAMTELKEIENRLKEIREAEATKLYRLAWKAEAHKAFRTADQVREEANRVYSMHNEDLLNPFVLPQFIFAFQTEGPRKRDEIGSQATDPVARARRVADAKGW